MGVKPTDDPREQIRQMVADARRDFAGDVDGLLSEVRTWSRSVGDAIGDVSRTEALRALRTYILERFDARLPMRTLADPVLEQLVREAYDHMNNPDSTVNVKDWSRVAEPFVKG